MTTPHQQSGGLEALIRERTQTFWDKNGNPDSLSSISQFHPDISGLLPQVIDEDRVISMTLAYEKGRADRDEEVRGIIEGMCKEFVPADSEWFGKDDYSEGEYKLVPAKDPKDAMYCLSCERFLHEEGCICGFIYKDNLLKALSPDVTTKP